MDVQSEKNSQPLLADQAALLWFHVAKSSRVLQSVENSAQVVPQQDVLAETSFRSQSDARVKK